MKLGTQPDFPCITRQNAEYVSHHGKGIWISISITLSLVICSLAFFLGSSGSAPATVVANANNSPTNVTINPKNLAVPKSASTWTFASVGGNTPLYYFPVTLANTQGSATPANLQQQITTNPSLYSAYYASNLANVNWQDGNGNILNSWLESGASSSSTTTVYWVNLGSNTIAANGGLTIYEVVYATSVTAIDGTHTGAYPTYTGTYGQYDDGSNVFTALYDNFAGTSLKAGWTTLSGCTPTVNNGVTLTTSVATGAGINWNSATFSPN
ncbi:MAG TPA: hypothetical protein VKK79_03215, partial [Candidatus Lokiarchaeia archaeon]|nr:hypothetical protein [Candidatus Lokiarchaeia archaeon]